MTDIIILLIILRSDGFVANFVIEFKKEGILLPLSQKEKVVPSFAFMFCNVWGWECKRVFVLTIIGREAVFLI